MVKRFVFSTVIFFVFVTSSAQSAPYPSKTTRDAHARRALASARRASVAYVRNTKNYERRLAGIQDLEQSASSSEKFPRASTNEESSIVQEPPSKSKNHRRDTQDLVHKHSNSNKSETGVPIMKKKERVRQKKKLRSEGEIESLPNNGKELEATRVSEAESVEYALEEGPRRQVLVSKVVSLLQRHRELGRLLESKNDAIMKISNAFAESLHRRNALSQATETARRARLLVERDIEYFKGHAVLQEESLNHLKSQVSKAKVLMNKLVERYNRGLKDEEHLKERFREHGLEHWVESSMRQSLNPVVLDAIMQGTEYVVEPMLEGIEKLATVNDEIADTVSQRLKNRISMAQKPFYSGFVSYTVLLCPLVILMSVLTRIRRSFSQLSSMHLIILMSLYYTLLTLGCLLALLIGSVDVLQTFRSNHLHLFNFLLVFHSSVYILLVVLHLFRSVMFRSIDGFGHFLILAAIGGQFINDAERQTLANQSLRVDPWVYLVYTAVLCFVLFELVSTHKGAPSPKVKGDRRASVAAIHADSNREPWAHVLRLTHIAG
ncbi:hypothetical protein BWQ96_01761 [Gracilariopsis chorda]|uniref:Uncharacterized protein n=1 Tax=Gracilariopsis chorda TaxID=448386 RepID=A0A2V3J3A1_9FLOR|nr:hypothetical protein BWQ96_01761 [Gracilariopsis chorda]|eukprot:PXF48592.1 hypothetical protein BWQ96_01761 [Gracilariopsis chorda]